MKSKILIVFFSLLHALLLAQSGDKTNKQTDFLITNVGEADSLITVGAYYYSIKRFDSTEYFLQKVLRFDSTNHRANYWMGLLNFNAYRNQERAEKYFLKAAQAAIPEDDLYIYLGVIYANKKDLDRAETFFNKELAITPDDTLSHLGLIDVYLKKAKPNKAHEISKDMLGDDSSSFKLLLNLGRVYSENKHYSRCIKFYKKIISMDSNAVLAYFMLGGVYTYLERNATAAAARKKAIALDSNYSISFYGFHIQDKYEYKKAHSLDSNYATSFAKLGWLYVITDHFPEAEMAYRHAIALDSINPSPFVTIGWMHLLMNNVVEAEKYLQQALSLDSTNVNAHTLLGLMDFNSGRVDNAEKIFLNVIKTQSDFTPALFGMAYVLSAKGKEDKAFDYLEEAIAKKKSMRQLRSRENFKSLKGTCLLHCLQGLTTEMLQHDEYLATLRESSRWNKLLEEYFTKKRVGSRKK